MCRSRQRAPTSSSATSTLASAKVKGKMGRRQRIEDGRLGSEPCGSAGGSHRLKCIETLFLHVLQQAGRRRDAGNRLDSRRRRGA
jgi:hypothetical protein